MLVTAALNARRLDASAHVWIAYSDQLAADLRTALASQLSASEMARMERFKFSADRDMFLIAHSLKRLALSWHAPSVRPSDWMFRIEEFGRPRICGPEGHNLCFNISHSGAMVACVVTKAIDCGIDVELLDRDINLAGLVSGVLTPVETAAINAVHSESQAAAFFRYWTLKEAYAKARGLGMSLPFKHINFSLENGTIAFSAAPEIDMQPSHYQFEQWEAGRNHVVSLALARGSAPDLRVLVHDQTDLALLLEWQMAHCANKSVRKSQGTSLH